MKIDGKVLAKVITSQIGKELKGVPKITLAIVTLGPEDAWEHYVAQKIKLARELGIQTRLINIKEPTEEKLITTIQQLNNDADVAGIIVQRPLTRHIQGEKITYAVSPKKDVDGFIKNSFFKPPVWLAVKDILEYAYRKSQIANRRTTGDERDALAEWLKSQKITVLGKGETAGMPVIEGLRGLGSDPNIIDSQTPNKDEIVKNSDIIISAVGRSGVFKVEDLKQGVIVIGIGLHREDTKLKPDFD
ncbi:MAG: bifunctional 5,10-methylenetetrahydrofolate dehydrogenase/5,10-methenyltetrahydrofolate cyclohydrolase, partial [Candidatus Levybacteria bacterium]|nr:bifunctional 5,10-methylenetetrahydrofolate dehydrogenase/5,10-methenyltetrahydrofolate cyclohydrolase [Candidatus Levybacteria bacterium]